MDSYGQMAVARQDTTHYFSYTLFELSTFVGIRPPTFHGKLLYRQYGLAKWEIKTIIPGLADDPSNESMEYSEEYPDWDYSIDSHAGRHRPHLPQVPRPHTSEFSVLSVRGAN